jgi:hypothetical protein
MAGNGPPSNPNAARRNTRVGMTRLPSHGYTGRLPKWPLPDNPKLTAKVDLLQDDVDALEERDLDEGLSRAEQTKLTRTKERLAIAIAERDAIRETEKVLWRQLWRTPQACEWARLKWDREVAQYARHKAAAEIGSIDDSREARLRGEALGLTPKGLRSLMWVIDADEVAVKRDEKTSGSTPPARPRLIAVDNTGS